ncbi:TPA: DNA (cytosine-5-)-methyltransferase [Pasteurella multocida]|uniref:DNA cytosine methyltransferase n=1 Tax=Pasteurella multocida TaxID=747 RepID=UPI0029458CD7|nr:DNA cytosine methyltransferase [Pasteurella multocida]MEB3481083.1 DNA cytosine methyltransferase [Pasteurella multocida]HDR1048088.1 DNA (cytosine-5-)-methyltransferase [Pasteurella multocida]HDR1140490.1 DNA (cytosine-5-)-methyltransferase [Pasteurella multocida]HED4432162.1 DNA (cytosine-5-)-methyltransferase [Pasteurella multocida]HEP0888682.1 DNA (cytosine-5-)-methyltransferase [Pasteurella multocida]
MIEAVDLFCGAGGLTAGLQKVGIKVKAGYDIEETCRFAFEFNNNAIFINKDVSLVGKSEILSWYKKGCIKLLAGCAPCQPFSKYNQGRDTRNDKKWPLLYAFARIIKESIPDLITMENVPEVVRHQVYHDFVAELEQLGYFIWAGTIKCVDYGLPQQRKRHVLLASKFGEIGLIPPTHNKDSWITVKKAIGHLPPISAGETCKKDRLHRAMALSEINLQRIKHSKQGGSWKDWPEELRAECHKKASGASYPAVYGRMSWEQPSPTITTLCYGYGNGRFGHPEQDRAISLREAAIFQAFPENYQFCDPEHPILLTKVGKMIGNAVPVTLGEIIGKSFIAHLEQVGNKVKYSQ